MLRGKKIIVGVTGSIAAYKALLLVRLLVKSGAEVKVIMTDAACEFVAPLSFSTLSGNDVLTGLVTKNTWANHVALGRWADVMIIAPTSCNTIARMSSGICDNLLMAVYLSSVCPVFIAPAMDEDMWMHPATQRNLSTIKDYGNYIIAVNHGELASGLTGEGRMAEPEEIFKILVSYFNRHNELAGTKALVTAGPTYEYIDPVRFISNRSSGQMGIRIAEELANRGASVTLILGPVQMEVPGNIEVVPVETAAEMYDAVMSRFADNSIIIMAAAVADYSAVKVSDEKIKKEEESFSLPLIKTNDILSKVGELKSESQTLVGFALETHNEKQYALEKLRRKNADYIVLNSLNDAGAGFGYETNKITIFEKSGKEFSFPLKTKREVAKDIVNVILQKEK